MAQYIHLLTNNNIGLPTDLWVPSTENVKPQRAWQVSTGYFRSIGNDWEFSIEAYYKNMEGLIEYKEGASFYSVSTDWYEKVESGSGTSKGLELFLQKRSGKTTGWIGYTLSDSRRKFQNISRGQWFPYKYDRRHDISVVVNHSLNDKLEISGTWVFGSGTAITFPNAKYITVSDFESMLYPMPNNYYSPNDFYTFVDNYEKRNSARMPAYHRLDLGFSFKKDKKWGKRTLSFGAYNIYNRHNAFYLYVDTKWEWDPSIGRSTSKETLYQVSLFTIIPYIKYSFNF